MIKERKQIINNFLAFIDVVIAWITLFIIYTVRNGEYLIIKDKSSLFPFLLIFIIWFTLSKILRLSELHRSRPYSVVLFNCIVQSVFGTLLFIFFVFLIEHHYFEIKPVLYFIIINITLTFTFKVFLFSIFKYVRKKGYNFRTVLIIGDKTGVPLVKTIMAHDEWGYKVVGVIGDDMKKYLNGKVKSLSEDVNIDDLLVEDTIDELIYCEETPDMKKVQDIIVSCNEVGVVFRMYSPFFNMLSNKTHIHYFGTTPLLTISNTPLDYLSLKLKSVVDILVAFVVVVALAPLYIFIALLIKTASKGPIFFKQVRVGLRGREFVLYKFRTMVDNAEALKEDLYRFNEMDGPTFKMTDDPRITKVGKFLRKTGLDELPQFFNILLGDMSIVGPRPPVPEEVKNYERWQLRRLSMKPGITCSWQISENRNDISFDDWMRMDMEYIDNWSLKLDFVIILKTVRAILRADGR